MKHIVLFLFLLIIHSGKNVFSQEAGNKYPSILWEITGKGNKKPSYLIGTMHVSSKLAFNLPDSFYAAIRNSQMVALETNPETWQEDMSKYDIDEETYSANQGEINPILPGDYFTINTLKFYKYNTKIAKALYSNPTTINNLLYRTYGNESSDFEEDTYLDMYIFQCGKKWGKKVTGVENYGESMRLMEEAYKDAAKEKNRKDRSYGDIDEDYTADKLQEAYRKGNLDLLDSINKYNSFSAAFDEKFLYRRNEIQANSIDSILKSGTVLFVGVGAAHLPGDRGVIELLRKKGYKLRPVKMGERASREKDLIDKLRVPVTFKTETANDGLFKVDIPGKFYKYGDNAALDQQHYADMANGSYYMVTRIMTNAWMWNHTEPDIYKTIDSLLYENVPGKIISKMPLGNKKYKGFDIINKTRRGDLQRYNIYITPFEIIFFKISGNGDYILNGDEAKKFFGSIRFIEYKSMVEDGSLIRKKYSSAFGGFAVDFPHEPYAGNDGSWIYDAADKQAGIDYRVIRTDINNFNFVEEDTFDLELMDESFRASEFIDTQLYSKQTNYNGYPSLECKYRDKTGAIFLTRYIIQGPHYYTVLAHGKKEMPAMWNFLNSFEIKPFKYRQLKLQKDTALYYTVTTPVFPEDKKIKLNLSPYNSFGGYEGDDEEEPESAILEGGVLRTQVVANDTTGEKIFITFTKASKYYYSGDSAAIFSDKPVSYMGDTTWIVRSKKKTLLPGNKLVVETIISDTGSSRTLWNKTFYRDGIGYSLLTQTDTLSKPSLFLSKFFETFSPSDSLKGINPFEKKTMLFFNDFNSRDSVLHKRAVKNIANIELDSSDFPLLKKAISSLTWEEKKYLTTKVALINKLGNISTNLSADFLKELYYSLDDTVQLQYPVLENLLQHKTTYAYGIFREIIKDEPPVLENSEGDYIPDEDFNFLSIGKNKFKNGKFLDELSDSLKLTKSILPDLLLLLNLDDYKSSLMDLLGQLVDSNLVGQSDYEIYFNKFLIEARQELKKQAIAEKRKAIEKVEDSRLEKKIDSYYKIEDEKGSGNSNLSLYARLLLPFWDTKPSVPQLIAQMLKSNDKRLKYNTMMLLLHNGKPCPDSLIRYFATLDEYRYELYTDLKQEKKLELFPNEFNNHMDLGRSALLDKKTYSKPDTLTFIDKLSTTYKGKKGLIYFFKYKEKKDDLNWKLATVGLVPENPTQFVFEDTVKPNVSRYAYKLFNFSKFNRYDFTQFTETKIKDNEPISQQLMKELKRITYSGRKSARNFFEENKNEDFENLGYTD